MAQQKTTDWQAVHKHFSTHCFNHTWELIEKPNRTSEDDLEMVQLAVTSLWHWKQRKDVAPTNLAIGYWQVSFVYALAGQPALALKYALMCKDLSEKLEAFYLGEAYQSLAGANKAGGNYEMMEEYIAKAHQILKNLTDPEEKEALERDLRGLDRVKELT
jgi:tetratricopeptide (TPR) repeat protein